MKFSCRIAFPQRLFPVILVVGMTALAGCGGGAAPVPTVGAVLPVSGHVTLGGKPLPGGSVILRPDKGKGNDSTLTPSGDIQPDGSYTIKTIDKTGAPPGWYKVTVTGGLPLPGAQTVSVPQRYASEADTPLAVEVVENAPAGAYDFKLTK